MTTENKKPDEEAGHVTPGVAAGADGSPQFVIRYRSVTGRKMWIASIVVDDPPIDDFGRTVWGTDKLNYAHKFTVARAEEMLPAVRKIHFDAWIERADGSRIQPHPADTESMDE